MKILVTGFDPFENEPTNPAIESVKRIDDEIEGAEIIKLEIPTVFQKSADVVEAKIREIKPDVILSVGQAGGRYGITVERVAINQDDARIKDNEGNQPIDVKIREDGQAAYFASIPIKAMVEEIKKENIPASVSNTAGTFVCNHIMYQDLYLAEKYGDIKAGFIHVPYLPEQVVDKKDTASMSLDDIVKGLNAAIRAIVRYNNKEDLTVTGGATH
ncbi:pyroglutamyl-peptidase I [uncultured Anaerococcus sp.]|uniref:pyroglutamyl-peptidase I n=1 Tax=uncultured Anaerococcus sp. TaxID=293428 RepID=UPI00260B5D22|nr:pyroglutamyl-peptidase I [uncultured Anaerococcus sp.]